MSLLARIPLVESARLVLRPVSADDLPALMGINGDPEVTRFLPYRTWQGLEDAHSWLARMTALHEAGSAAQLVLQRKADAAVLGTLLIFRHEAAAARAEIGYVLGRAHWGQGWMLEAVKAACAHAFGPLGLRRLEAEVNPANRASCAVLERAGFVHEGTARQRWCGHDGVPYDVRSYGRLASDPLP